MAGAPRITYANWLTPAGVSLVPSSEELGMPRSSLIKPSPSDVLRFKKGWDFRANENDGIEFNPGGGGGVKRAVVTGHFDTAAAVATAWAAALEVAHAPGTWTVSRVGNKFRISDSTPSFPHDYLFATGADKTKSAHRDLGFADLDYHVDPYPFDAAVDTFQSRRWVHIDFGALRDVRAAIIRSHNIGAQQAPPRLDLLTATSVGVGVASAPASTIVLEVDGRLVIATNAPRQFARLVIDDVSNALGYTEVGLFYPAGPTVDLPGFKVEVADSREALSQVLFALGGAHHQVRRGTRKVWRLTAHKIDAQLKDQLDAFNEQAKAGGTFFFTFNSLDPTSTRYVFMTREVEFVSQDTDPVTWNVELELLDVMG